MGGWDHRKGSQDPAAAFPPGPPRERALGPTPQGLGKNHTALLALSQPGLVPWVSCTGFPCPSERR